MPIYYDEMAPAAPTAPPALVPTPPPADEVDENYRKKSTMSDLARGFERGRQIIERGAFGMEARATEGFTPAETAQTRLLNERLTALGEAGEGFIGWLDPAAEAIGQLANTLFTPKTAQAALGGATVGGAIGAAGGPGGAAVGAAAGIGTNLAIETFRTEAGNSYLDMIEQGVSHDDAWWLSAGVGSLNAALEFSAAGILLRPFKGMVRKKINDTVVDYAKRSAIAAGAKQLGKGVAAEVTTEVLQELVGIGAESIGLARADLETLSTEEIIERVGEVTLKTIQSAAVLAFPGSGAAFINERRRARSAKLAAERMDQIQQVAKTLPPEQAEDTTRAALRQGNLKQVWLDAQTVQQLAMQVPDPTGLYNALGGRDGSFISIVEEAAVLGGDVVLDETRVAALLQNDEMYSLLKDHIRYERDGVSAAEAKEAEAEVQAEIDKAEAQETAVVSPARDFTERAFHGSRDVFEEFDPKKSILGRDTDLQAIFFSTKPDLANMAAMGTMTDSDPVTFPEDESFVNSMRPLLSDTDFKELAKKHKEWAALNESGDNPDRASELYDEMIKTAKELTAFVDPETEQPTRAPNVRPVRIDPGKQLVFDMGGSFSWEKETEALKQAKREGYDSVRLVNLTSDPHSLQFEGDIIAVFEGDRIIDEFEARRREIGGPTLAEAEMGLQALFRTAKDAGMTDKQYEAYLVQVQRAADDKVAAARRREAKEELAEVRKEIAQLREGLREVAGESVRQQPVYAALTGIGRERLDRDALVRILPGGEKQLDQLPKQDGRVIYSRKRDKGIDPEVYADMHGFDGADIMLFQMIDAPPLAQAIEAETDRLFNEQYYGVNERQRQLENEIEDLHNDGQAAVLATELNALREAKKQGRLKPRLIKNAAKERLRDMPLKEINPKTFLANERRHAKAAARLLRKGDRTGAAREKFLQLVNFYMAQEAYRTREKTKSQHRWLKAFTRPQKKGATLPLHYHRLIRALMGVVDLNRPQSIKELVELAAAEGVIIEIPVETLDRGGKKHYLELTLREWEQLVQDVKATQHAGMREASLAREAEKETRAEVAGGVADMIRQNLPTRKGGLTETNWEAIRRGGRQYLDLLWNMDTQVRRIDGWQNLGPAYNALKKPYDDGISRGYLQGQKGFNARMLDESKKLKKIFSVWTKGERRGMNSRRKIPGVRGKVSHAEHLAVLLNTGNIQNRTALTESGQLTDAEIDALINAATLKDWNFVQSVWDYLEEFWPEVKTTVERRQNREAKKVENSPIETPFGTFRGGYYPLHYTNVQSLRATAKDDVNNIIQTQRFGQFTVGHTRDGHTMTRVGSNKAAVDLNLFAINRHVNQVVYDLEMGDAIADIYKILHSSEVKDAFRETGNTDTHRAMELWFADIVMGEMHYGDFSEKMLRHMRTGFVVSKMAFSATVTSLQVLGLLQSMPLLGKFNVLKGTMQTLALSPFALPGMKWSGMDPYAFVRSQSPFMEQRQANFNREIHEAAQGISSSFVEKWTPGSTAKFVASMAFYGLVKMQSFVDTATWLAAKRQGMAEFGDEQKAIEHADRMVARTQASGIFGERTALERGTTAVRFKQSELVRAFVPLMGYFLAKTNVMYERVNRTNFKNPIQVADLAVDLMLMYTAEAVFAYMMFEGIPEEDETWNIPFTDIEVSPYLAIPFVYTVKSAAGGAPGLRDLANEAEGFRGGGVPTMVLSEIKRMMDQINQGEFDLALAKSVMRVAGTLTPIPGMSQIIRITEAEVRRQEGEDIDVLDYMLGTGPKK